MNAIHGSRPHGRREHPDGDGQGVRAGTRRRSAAGPRRRRRVAGRGDGDRLRAEIDAILKPVPDRWPGEGPLGGITTALAAARHPVVVVLACDLPNVTPDAVRAVLEGLEFGADAAVPGRHVLLAAYRRTCRTIFEAAMAVGIRAPRDALEGLDVADVTLAGARWADNANTPADL
jgi:molybdopterin-guanine dinucleotide biosynthesis protein A